MIVNKNKVLPLVKINTPSDISFYEEHKKVLNTYGEVWFARFGKNNMNISSLDKSGIIFIRDSMKNNGDTFVGVYTEISTLRKTTIVPEYYHRIDNSASLWFKLISLEKINPALLIDNFVTASSNNAVSNTLRSMCTAFFVKCINDVEF